jgi:hypothetical protein
MEEEEAISLRKQANLGREEGGLLAECDQQLSRPFVGNDRVLISLLMLTGKGKRKPAPPQNCIFFVL